MCGICGVFGKNNNIDGVRVKEMMSTLAHRGPNDRGFYADENCSLGHDRLSILDLSERGKQPMCNESKTIWMVVNGEVYNYKDLRRILIEKGHHFNSESDSEVIIHSYEEYGPTGFINHLRGMFSLAIYDKYTETLILARDPVGKKPLYYWNGRHVAFASEIKALFEAGVPKEVNYSAIPSWMQYQYTIGSETMFKGIYKVRAGTMLMFHDNNMKTISYWKPSSNNIIIKSKEQSVQMLRENLEESVKLRMQSDVPVGTFLSGGVDSSAVTALYRKFNSGKIHTFTVSFETKSESKYARTVSEFLGTEYHEVPITLDMVSKDLEKIMWHYDEPLGEQATICNYYLAKEAKKFVTVVLAGEGGDELFGGYPWHPYANLLGRISRIPYWLRRPVSRLLNGDVTSKTYTTHRLLSVLGQRTLEESLLYPTTAMSKAGVEWMLEIPREVSFLETHRESSDSKVYLNRMLELDLLNLLPEKFLMKADKGTMAFAIEERLPILDRNVMDLAFQISPDIKKDKWVFRKSVSDLLPEEITWRPKQGFGTPYGSWLQKGPIHRMALDRICEGEFLQDICNPHSLIKIATQLRESNKVADSGRMALGSTNVIWGLFALQMWHDIWF